MEKKAPKSPRLKYLGKIFDNTGWTRKKISEELGIGRKRIWSWIKNNATGEPKFSEIHAIGEKFDIDMNWMFYGEGEMYKKREAKGDTARGHILALCPAPDKISKEDTKQNEECAEADISEAEMQTILAQHKLNDETYRTLQKLGADQDTMREATHYIFNTQTNSPAQIYSKMRDLIISTKKAMSRYNAPEEEIIDTIMKIIAPIEQQS